MPFEYQPFVNPYGASMGDLIARSGDAAAHAAEMTAQAQARAAEIRGRAWGGAAQAIGQIPTEIAASKDAAVTRKLKEQELSARNMDLQERTQQRMLATQARIATTVGSLAKAAGDNPDEFGTNVQSLVDLGAIPKDVGAHILQNIATAKAGGPDAWRAFQKQHVDFGAQFAKTTKLGEGDKIINELSGATVAEGTPKPPTEVELALKAAGGDAGAAMDRLKPAPQPTEAALALKAAGGDAAGAMHLLKPAAKKTEAEQALDAYAVSIGKTDAAQLTDADRQAFVKRDAQTKADLAFSQHQREHTYDLAHPAPVKGKSQDELEQEARGVLQREFSSRSGGLGTEDAKVNQAIHLLTLMDQYEGKPMPAQIHGELALGLARLTSPNGQVGIELEREFKQKTAAEGVSKAVAYLTGDPTLVNATPEKLREMLRDSITRQGHVAEENRQTYLGAMLSMLPTQLEEHRRAAISKAVELNKVDTVKMRAPNGDVSDVSRKDIEHYKALGAKVIGG